jgi:hypothetical protein
LSDNKQDSIEGQNSVSVSEEQKVFADLMSEYEKLKPSEVQVDLHGGYYFGKPRTENKYSICIDTASFQNRPKETYIKLINMNDMKQFDMFMTDSTFHAPFEDGTLHSIEFISEGHIITQLKNFEGRIMSTRSYKKENGSWKTISARFHYHIEEYVYPFN